LSDYLQRFTFAEAPIRGQWVRLEQVLAEVASRQAYPDGVAALLGEMLAAVAMVSEGIQFDGAVSLQSRGSGPLTTVLAECREHSLLRGIARWPESQPPPEAEETALPELLGDGHFAITLTRPAADPADEPFSYQGLIELSGDNLAANLERYFLNSEQLPTLLFFAPSAQRPHTTTGLLLQRLPSRDRATQAELELDDKLWREVQAQARALDHQELARLDPEELLSGVFERRIITLHPPQPLRFDCSCSRERSSNTLRALPQEELLSLLAERGSIQVCCEICGESYDYDAHDVHLLLEPEPPTLH
jgi:molecular chaperone Hsp33